jgi:sensor histidine kinase regulating citrate/malate metabolism
MKSAHSSKLDRFWAIAGAVSIRTKILGIVLALVLLLGIGITLQVRAALAQTMDAQLQEQSVSIARDLAARSTDLILINDLYALHQLLLETQANNANVRYAFIVDSQNHVLAHTFGQGFATELLAANSVTATEHHRTLTLNTDEGIVWDTAVPIFDGQAGIARVGLSETSVRRSVDVVTGQLLLTTLAVSVVGITAAAFLT